MAFRVCLKHLTDARLRRGLLLSGPRRVGKSTILRQVAAALVEGKRDPRSILYLSLDQPLLKMHTIGQLLEMYHETIHPVGRDAVLLLDEVHYSKDWDLQLKSLIDHQAEYRILATGSASVRARQSLTDSGVGRWVTVPIPTLSFYEFVRIRGEEPPAGVPEVHVPRLFTATPAEIAGIGSAFRPLMPLFDRYLLVGGFPETARLGEDVGLCQRLLREDIVERVLKRDMTTLFGVRQVADLERLFIYLCYHTGGLLNVLSCSSELGVTRPTVTNYLDLLEQANLVYRLGPESLGGKKMLKAQHKYYLVDAALRNAMLLRGEEILRDPTELGHVVETAILRHLHAFYYPVAPRLSYWSDSRTRCEVDIVVRYATQAVPFEVKYRDRPDPSPGLAMYCDAEHDVSRAYVITRHERDFGVAGVGRRGIPVLRIPAHIFTHLIGGAEHA